MRIRSVARVALYSVLALAIVGVGCKKAHNGYARRAGTAATAPTPTHGDFAGHAGERAAWATDNSAMVIHKRYFADTRARCGQRVSGRQHQRYAD